jgi:hypothetical protein
MTVQETAQVSGAGPSPQQGKWGGAAVRKDEQTSSSELIIVTEPDGLIERPTPMAVLTLQIVPDPGWLVADPSVPLGRAEEAF